MAEDKKNLALKLSDLAKNAKAYLSEKDTITLKKLMQARIKTGALKRMSYMSPKTPKSPADWRANHIRKGDKTSRPVIPKLKLEYLDNPVADWEESMHAISPSSVQWNKRTREVLRVLDTNPRGPFSGSELADGPISKWNEERVERAEQSARAIEIMEQIFNNSVKEEDWHNDEIVTKLTKEQWIRRTSGNKGFAYFNKTISRNTKSIKVECRSSTGHPRFFVSNKYNFPSLELNTWSHLNLENLSHISLALTSADNRFKEDAPYYIAVDLRSPNCRFDIRVTTVMRCASNTQERVVNSKKYIEDRLDAYIDEFRHDPVKRANLYVHVNEIKRNRIKNVFNVDGGNKVATNRLKAWDMPANSPRAALLHKNWNSSHMALQGRVESASEQTHGLSSKFDALLEEELKKNEGVPSELKWIIVARALQNTPEVCNARHALLERKKAAQVENMQTFRVQNNRQMLEEKQEKYANFLMSFSKARQAKHVILRERALRLKILYPLQKKWMMWIEAINRLLIFQNHLTLGRNKRILIRTKLRAVRKIQRIFRMALRRKRRWRCQLALNTTKSFIRIAALNFRLTKNDRAADMIRQFFEVSQGQNCLNLMINNFKRSIQVLQRFFRDQTIVRRTRLQIYTEQVIKHVQSRNDKLIHVEKPPLDIPEEIISQCVRFFHKDQVSSHKKQLETYFAELREFKDSQKLYAEADLEADDTFRRPMKPYIPLRLNEMQLQRIYKRIKQHHYATLTQSSSRHSTLSPFDDHTRLNVETPPIPENGVAMADVAFSAVLHNRLGDQAIQRRANVRIAANFRNRKPKSK